MTYNRDERAISERAGRNQGAIDAHAIFEDATATDWRTVSWRRITDWAKQRDEALRLADRLGRGRGRFRVLDRIGPPQKPARQPDLSDWNSYELAACWVGHATVLLRIAGMNVLTDPVFGNRVGIGMGLFTGGPKRLVAPAVSIRQLSAIGLDLILLSHAHFDHLDRPSLQRLSKSTPVVTASGTRDLVDDLGFRKVVELAWGESTTIGDLDVRAVQVKHWGARTFRDHHRGYNAYLLGGGGRRILYGGDSAFHRGLREIGQERPVDLAIIGIGAYDPYVAAHATPEQGWQMGLDAQAKNFLPIHHSTFRLSHEPTAEPLQRLMKIAGADAKRIVAEEIGKIWHL
jgi:L-ascorbate metabolism protein UlaG (beta-lactamase superfamily)